MKLLGQEGNFLKVNRLMYADDTVMFGNSTENLQQSLNEFEKFMQEENFEGERRKSSHGMWED